MAQCNFVDNVLHDDVDPLHVEIILNTDMMADMAASPEFNFKFKYRYTSTSERDIGPGYTIKLENEEENLVSHSKSRGILE